MECVTKAAPLTVGTGVVGLDGLKAKHPGVLVEVLRYRQRFVEVDWSSLDKVDKV